MVGSAVLARAASIPPQLSARPSGAFTRYRATPANVEGKSTIETKRRIVKMGTFSAWHWLIVLAICLLLFGRGKIPQLMADLGRGISEFKKGTRDPEDDERQRQAD